MGAINWETLSCLFAHTWYLFKTKTNEYTYHNMCIPMRRKLFILPLRVWSND